MVLKMDRKQLAIDFAKSIKHEWIEKIILFGPVARGDDGEGSDIDILVITSNESDENTIRRYVSNNVWDILLSTGEYISVKIRTNDYYNKNRKFSFIQCR